MERKDNDFQYRGGLVNKDIAIDPDYMTWCMFEGFCEDNGSNGKVKHVWYKLPQESMESVKVILELASDASINQMCCEAMKVGGVDIYIEQSVGEQVPENGEEDRGEEDSGEEERDEEAQNNGESSNARDEVEEEVIEEAEDIPFQSLFGDNHDDEVRGATSEEVRDADNEEIRGAGCDDDEEELERQLKDNEHPAPAVDTDDEWDYFNRQEKVISRTTYSNEKPPYLWLMPTFKSGEEFKDQILRYVLKTNFDVKLCRWEKTKLGAICTKENCEWKIYCSVEKPKGK